MPSPFPTRTRRYTVKAERQLGSSFLFGFPRFFTFDVTPGLFTLTGRLRTNVFPLENGRLYRLSVVATNAAGDSDQSLPFVFGRPLGAPGAPRRLEATSDENQASTLTWLPPSEDGGAAVDSYIVRYGRVAAGFTDEARFSPELLRATEGGLVARITGLMNNRCGRRENAHRRSTMRAHPNGAAVDHRRFFLPRALTGTISSR